MAEEVRQEPDLAESTGLDDRDCLTCLHWAQAGPEIGQCKMATMPETIVCIHVKIPMPPRITVEEAKESLSRSEVWFFTPPDHGCKQWQERD